MPWYEETVAKGVEVIGKPLAGPETARTVRVRNGETLVTDGPYVETKEFIGGIGILECESLEQAIEVTARHPVAGHNAIELRELVHLDGIPDGLPAIDSDEMRQLLLVCVDGIAEADEVEAQIASDAAAWREAATAAGINVLNQPLAGPEEATVGQGPRGRDARSPTARSSRPRSSSAGFDILNCAALEDAVGWAARHPLTAFHMAEVRQFVPFEGA